MRLVAESEGLSYFFDPFSNQKQFFCCGHLLLVKPLLGCLPEFLGEESFQLPGRVANQTGQFAGLEMRPCASILRRSSAYRSVSARRTGVIAAITTPTIRRWAGTP